MLSAPTFHRIRFAVLLLVPLLWQGQAQAQEESADPKGSIYLSLKGGWAIGHNSALGNLGDYLFNESSDGDVAFGSDTTVGASIGYRSSRAWRLEFEVVRWTNSFDEVQWNRVGKFGNFPTTGEIEATSYMVNYIGEFPPWGNFTMFMGAGLGAADFELKNVTDSDGPLFSGNATSLAIQFLIGVDYALTERVSMSLGYKIFNSFFSPQADPGQPDIGGHDVVLPVTTSSFLAGISYRF